MNELQRNRETTGTAITSNYEVQLDRVGLGWSHRVMMRRICLVAVILAPACGPQSNDTADAGTGAGLTTGADLTTSIASSSGEPVPTSTGGESSENSGTSETTDTPPSPACGPSDLPGGTLRWSIQDDELPQVINHLVVAPGGDIVVIGREFDSNEQADADIFVYDAAGQLRWTDRYSGEHGLGDYATGLAIDAAGFIHVLVREQIRHDLEPVETEDTRLVVLRYTPDGVREWRWEREHPPVAEGEHFNPHALFGEADGDLFLLEGVPTASMPRLVRLDTQANVLADTALALPQLFSYGGSIGPHGLHIAGTFEGGNTWLARFGLDGAPTWDTTIVTDGFPYVLRVGPDATLHLAFNPPGEPDQPTYEVRRFSPNGAPLSVETFDYGPAPGNVATGALHCDGTLLLAGSIATPPTPDDQVVDRKDAWLTRHTMGGAQQWTTSRAFGPPVSVAEAWRMASTPDGDILVVVSYRTISSNYSYWLGRYAGG